MPQTCSQTFLREPDEKLWAAADRLRSDLDATVYKHAVLGLIFLKYVSDSFAQRQKGAQAPRLFLEKEKATGKMPMLPYKITSTGKLIDDALEAIEKENPKLKGVLGPVASVADRRYSSRSIPRISAASSTSSPASRSSTRIST